ncbi:MAG: hypothetical protein ABW007_02145 [Chitinophagaceae bacterium]
MTEHQKNVMIDSAIDNDIDDQMSNGPKNWARDMEAYWNDVAAVELDRGFGLIPVEGWL